MPSKYDAFWQQREEDLVRLLREAVASGRSELAVPELRAVGDRRRWAASVSVAAGKILAANGAHGTSLGRILARLSQMYPDTAFRASITEDLFLRIHRTGTGPEDSRGPTRSLPPPPRGEPRHLGTPPGDLNPAAEGEPAAIAGAFASWSDGCPASRDSRNAPIYRRGASTFGSSAGRALRLTPGSCGWASTRADTCGTGLPTTTAGPGAGPPSAS